MRNELQRRICAAVAIAALMTTVGVVVQTGSPVYIFYGAAVFFAAVMMHPDKEKPGGH